MPAGRRWQSFVHGQAVAGERAAQALDRCVESAHALRRGWFKEMEVHWCIAAHSR